MFRLVQIFPLVFSIALCSAQTLIKNAELLKSEIHRSVNRDTALANRLIQLSKTELNIGLKDSAILHSNQGAVISASLSYLPGVLQSKFILIQAEIDKKKYSIADSVWRKTLTILNQISPDDKRNFYEASLYTLKGVLWTRRLKADSSLHYLNIASSKLLPGVRDQEYEHVRLTIYYNRAISQNYQSKRDSATKYFLKALDLAGRINDTVGLAQVNLEYATRLHFDLPEEAIKHATACVNLSKRYGMMIMEEKGLDICARIYYRLMKTDSTSHFYRRALKIARMFPHDSTNLADLLAGYTQNLLTVDSLDQAEKSIREASTLIDTRKFSYLSFDIITQYVNVLHARKKYDEEWKMIQEAEKMTAGNSIPDCAELIYEQKIEYFKAIGNYKAALAQTDQLTALRDTSKSHQQVMEVAEINTKYETEKKDKEIIKLNADKELAAAQISHQRTLVFMLIGFSLLLAISGFSVYKRIQLKRKTEIEISRLERVNEIQNIRNRISRDMHDDIGASLSKMGMLAQQAKLQVQKGKPEDSITTFDKITNQSKEVVSGLSTIRAINPQHDNLKSMLGFMRNYISDFFEGNAIRYSIDFPDLSAEVSTKADVQEDIAINPELKRNLFLVLKEALNNVVKHSKATEVKIRFVINEGKYQFQIIDNGTGVDLTKDKSFSNGLISMKKRMEEIKGLFRIHSENERGTMIELEGVLF